MLIKGTRSLPNVFLYSLCIDRKEHEELRRIKVWTKKFARVALFYEALRNVIKCTICIFYHFRVKKSHFYIIYVILHPRLPQKPPNRWLKMNLKNWVTVVVGFEPDTICVIVFKITDFKRFFSLKLFYYMILHALSHQNIEIVQKWFKVTASL